MQLIATLAVVVSVLVLAYQGHELSGHTRVANQVAGTEAHSNLLYHWKSVIDVFIQHPELHAYYYGQTTEAPSESDSVRLNVIAEQHGDLLESGMILAAELKSYSRVEQNTGLWPDYVAGVLASSPVLRSWIREHPSEIPTLVPILASYDAAQGGNADVPVVDLPPTPDLGQQ